MLSREEIEHRLNHVYGGSFERQALNTAKELYEQVDKLRERLRKEYLRVEITEERDTFKDGYANGVIYSKALLDDVGKR